mgnify:CR=1 FL=1
MNANLFVQVQNELGVHDSNYLMNLTDEVKVLGKSHGGYRKPANANLTVGDDIMVSSEWAHLKSPRQAKVVQIDDWDRDGLNQTSKINLFQKHLYLFAANPTALEKQFGDKARDYGEKVREIFQVVHDRLKNYDVDETIDLTGDDEKECEKRQISTLDKIDKNMVAKTRYATYYTEAIYRIE